MATVLLQNLVEIEISQVSTARTKIIFLATQAFSVMLTISKSLSFKLIEFLVFHISFK